MSQGIAHNNCHKCGKLIGSGTMGTVLPLCQCDWHRPQLDYAIGMPSPAQIRCIELEQELTKLKQERDELAAQVEVMQSTFGDILNHLHKQDFIEIWAREALSITPSDALREIQARTLEEFGEKYRLVYRSTGEFIGDVVQELAVHEAAEIRKGE